MAEPEPIIFNEDNKDKNKLPSFRLLVNPETLTLTWRKVLNRVRTKTRLVTLFWGEEPVRFTYAGQTGYLKPSTKILGSEDATIEDYNKQQLARSAALTTYITKLEGQIKAGGPFSFATEARNVEELSSAREELRKIRVIQPGQLLEKVGIGKKATDLLLTSDKFILLKKLEELYRHFQDPSNLVDLKYRKYKFEGYFESFSFTDDARNPWNWKYTFDFTILTWQDNAAEVTQNNEYLFIRVSEKEEWQDEWLA